MKLLLILNCFFFIYQSGCKNKEAISSSSASSASAESEKWHRAIIYFTVDGKLKIDYEGSGLRQRSGYSGVTKGKIHFKAMHLDSLNKKDFENPKHVDASFEGKWSVSGDNERDVKMNLKIENKVPLEIVFLAMSSKELSADKSKKAVDFIKEFPAGGGEVNFSGTIRGYIEK